MRCRPLHSVRSPRPAYVARPASGQRLRTACSERQLSEPWMTASGLLELLQRVGSSRSASGAVRLLTALLLRFDRSIASQPMSRFRPGSKCTRGAVNRLAGSGQRFWRQWLDPLATRVQLGGNQQHVLAVPARLVDHITPARTPGVDFFDTSNLQPLCNDCHERKSAREGSRDTRTTSPARGASKV
jgi:hypothetical protein